ncbi:MAG: hypothetical protein HC805_03075 [Alkalinema sp. RL_2_19]|nr:hypothetical protein [Alkalinema sp. RL_2_19]
MLHGEDQLSPRLVFYFTAPLAGLADWADWAGGTIGLLVNATFPHRFGMGGV